jgi:hypothetical protein
MQTVWRFNIAHPLMQAPIGNFWPFHGGPMASSSK